MSLDKYSKAFNEDNFEEDWTIKDIFMKIF